MPMGGDAGMNMANTDMADSERGTYAGGTAPPRRSAPSGRS
jgi:hypothetical protein